MKKLHKNITHIILLLVVLLIMAACQPTPTSLVVVPKTEKAYNQMLYDAGVDIDLVTGEITGITLFDNEPVEPSIQYTAPQSLNYVLELNNTTVIIDAEIEIPDAAIPIYMIEPRPINYEHTNAFLDVVCDEDTELYEDVFFRQAFTKKQYEVQIDNMMKQIDSLIQQDDSLTIGAPKEEIINSLKEILKILYKDLETAPEDYAEARELLEYGDYDMYGKIFTKEKTYPVEITESNFDKSNYRLAIGYSPSYLSSINIATEHYKRQQLLYSNEVFDSTEVKDISIDTVENIIQSLLDTTDGITTDNYIFIDRSSTFHLAYEYKIGRQLNGVSTNLFNFLPGIWKSRVNNNSGVIAYDEKYSQEAIRVLLNMNGDMEMLIYNSPMSPTMQLTSDAKLLPFDRIQEIFDRHIVLNGFTSTETIILNIDEIKLGLQRIAVPNSEQYMLIPVWDFYGGFIVKNPINIDGMNILEVDRSDISSCSLLTINALNGAIIDIGTGY